MHDKTIHRGHTINLGNFQNIKPEATLSYDSSVMSEEQAFFELNRLWGVVLVESLKGQIIFEEKTGKNTSAITRTLIQIVGEEKGQKIISEIKEILNSN